MPVPSPRESRRPIIALGGAVLGTVAMTLWMAIREPLPRGPLWGAVLTVITTIAWVAWLVPRSADPAIPWHNTTLGKRPGELLSPLACAALALLALGTGAAVGGYPALPVTIVVALACFVPSALRRPGLAVMIVIAAIYLPLLGATTLWDPWETHYGEVAREILARNDWISLWWAQDKWFWSKPVLLFWLEALSMGAMGIDFMPDANPAHPEWAIRLPVALMALGALAGLYATVRRFFGPRTGALATLVTATMPQFFFLSHQAITDLPLVAAITIAVCCLVTALQEDPDRRATMIRFGPWKLSLPHVVLFGLIAVALPQATYLISRNVSWIDGYGLVAHPDRFLYGSAGNVDVPGNPQPRDQSPSVPGLWGQPFLQGIFWLGILAVVASILRREQRAQALWVVAFYLSCAIAFMAKGLAGLAIPGGAALLYLVASQRWELLGSGKLRVSLGILVVSAVSLPWYLAMYVRHGVAFTNRLLIHDHINRLAAGVHGDTGTISYFVNQLGYATFPWIALVPLALLGAVWVLRPPRRTGRTQAVLFFSMWLLSAFVLFSAMVTKFHHYILPLLVPLGALIGIGLAPHWGPKRPLATVLSAGAAVCAVLGFAWLTGDIRGVIPEAFMEVEDWVLRQREPTLAASALGGAALLGALAQSQIVKAETKLEPSSRSTAAGVALVLGLCLLAFVGRDLSWTTSARPQGNERLIHLFVYKYSRVWPEHLDYRAPLTGFSIAACCFVGLASLRRWRAVGIRGLGALAVLFCIWSLDVYMVDLSGHWGIRDLAARYYAERQSAEEPLLAWQMNWKGENFYTGNRVHVFAETNNKRLEKWLEQNQGRRIYVLLERKRLERFTKLVRDGAVTVLSTPRDNNKVVLVTLEIGSENPGKSSDL